MSNRSGRMLPVCSSLILALWANSGAKAQQPAASNPPTFKTVAANTDLLLGLSHSGLMGQRYRLEWSVPVRVPVAMLDTLRGGLTTLHKGNDRQSQVLYLQGNDGKLYALRSVQKLPERQLPDIYQNTIVSDMAQDLASAFHPYAPLTIGPLARAAGVPYAPVQLVYIPNQTRLGTYNAAMGNGLYFLQQAPYSTNADTTTQLISTTKLLHLLDSSQQYRVDAEAYLRMRLLDMLLGITQRGSAQWRWLAQPEGGVTTFLPVPENYEGAFALYHGKYLQLAKAFAKLQGLHSFEHQLPEPQKLNATALHLDRRLTNGLDRAQWEGIARQVRMALTDAVLQQAVHQLPSEVQPLSAAALFNKLKSRRNTLEQYAMSYYNLLATRVDITATALADKIDIQGKGKDGMTITLTPKENTGNSSGGSGLYNRTFHPGETKTVNVYGLGGEDLFVVSGHPDKKLKVRIIGGPQYDSIATTNEGGNIHYYDSRSIATPSRGHTRLHLTNNLAVHRYDWESYGFDKKGFRPIIFYNNKDRIYAGASYQWTRHGWRKEPFAQQHKIQLNYSLLQGGISAEYEGVFNQLIGAWNGTITAEYDAVRWTNFFGIGNETPPQVEDNNFHRMRTAISTTSAGLFRMLGKYHSIGFSGQFQTVKVRNDVERYVGKILADDDPLLYRTHRFAGASATYNYQNTDNVLIPHKGLLVNGSATYTKNLTLPEKEIMTYASNIQAFIPLGKRWVLSSLGGLIAVTGEPEFYQLAIVGGGATLRGFRRERFWGKTGFYNQNELQYLFPFRSYWFNGTAGLFGLVDMGRVWQPGETSDKMHRSIGAGLILSPFHKVRLSVAFARSEERGTVHIGFRGSL